MRIRRRAGCGRQAICWEAYGERHEKRPLSFLAFFGRFLGDFGDVTGAGISLRIPFFENLVRIDKRVLSVDMERQQVLSREQLRLEVDAYARFRIIDPVRMVRTAGTTERVKEQLQPIFTSVLRQELGKRTFQSLLTAERGQAMRNIREGLENAIGSAVNR